MFVALGWMLMEVNLSILQSNGTYYQVMLQFLEESVDIALNFISLTDQLVPLAKLSSTDFLKFRLCLVSPVKHVTCV